jgi:hypothetical protein
MNPKISELLDRIQQMELEIEQEMKRKRAELQADFEETRVRFEHEVLEQQRRFKTGILPYLLSANLWSVVTAPVIYSVLLPMLLLDLFITVYQHICFRAYGIARVKRSNYFVYDRAHLAYLNLIEKINCAYCSYGNGLMAYGREVVARTEQYWCPIKHARKIMAAHPYYTGFVDFGDAQSYKDELEKLRTELAKLK